MNFTWLRLFLCLHLSGAICLWRSNRLHNWTTLKVIKSLRDNTIIMEQSGSIVMKIQGKNVVLYLAQLRELTSKVLQRQL